MWWVRLSAWESAQYFVPYPVGKPKVLAAPFARMHSSGDAILHEGSQQNGYLHRR